MKRMISSAVVALVTIGAALSLAQSRLPDKPVRQYKVHADGGYGASSLVDLWRLSDVVVEVSILRVRPGVAPGTGGPEDLPKTNYEAQVLQAFKTDAETGANSATMTLARLGGRVERRDHIAEYRDDRLPPLVTNQTYILFLRRDRQGDYWPATADGDSAFAVDGEAVKALGNNALARSIAALSTSQLRDALRKQKGGES